MIKPPATTKRRSAPGRPPSVEATIRHLPIEQRNLIRRAVDFEAHTEREAMFRRIIGGALRAAQLADGKPDRYAAFVAELRDEVATWPEHDALYGEDYDREVLEMAGMVPGVADDERCEG